MSVIIPCRNAATTIEEQLQALTAQDYQGSYEVILVDNGSTDGTADVARAFQGALQQLRIVPASERTGVNYVRNVGAFAADGDVLLICDADDVVAPRWIGSFAGALEELDGAGGPLTLLEPYNPSVRALRNPGTGGLGTPMNFLPRPYGCNCAVRTAVFHELGGFDERYAGGGDADEFFWRLQLRGYKFGFAPGALVRYRLRPTVQGTLKQLYGYAKAKPQLYGDFRTQGLRRSQFRSCARGWAWLVVAAPSLLVGPRATRLKWLRAAVRNAGYIAGSIRHGVLYVG